MAILRTGRAKKLIASGLNDKLNYMGLYQHQHNVDVGSILDLRQTVGKSDESPFFAVLNKQTGLDKYKVINDFSQIEWSESRGSVVGLQFIMNFFIKHPFQVSKIVITDKIDEGGYPMVMAVVQFPTITPTNGEDENFLINLFEILID